MERKPVTFSSHQISNHHRFYLYGVITDPENYIDLIEALDTCSENDTIAIHLNTPGGLLTTTLAIIHAIQRTQAHVIAVLDGEVASAGTIIMLSCKEFVVGSYSYFMSHDASSGFAGKFSEQFAYAEHSKKFLEHLYQEVYFPFFSREEIDNILYGRDEYLVADEIIERLNHMFEYNAKEAEKDLDLFDEPLEPELLTEADQDV